MAGTGVTMVVGGAGSGKSALVAALSRPEVAPDLTPVEFLHAVAFAALSPTTAEIADELAGQLRRVPGFVGATQRYRTGFDAEAFERQPALQRQILGPMLALALAPGRRVRIAVDGVDQLDPAVREDLLVALTALSLTLGGVRVLITTRPGAVSADDGLPEGPRPLSTRSSGTRGGGVLRSGAWGA